MPEGTVDSFIERRALSKPTYLYFTLDYRQFIEGELRPGEPCRLRYDPARMPAPDDYAFGKPEEPVVAHIKFKENGPALDVPLRSKIGIMRVVDADPTGRGSMLDGQFTLPGDAEKVTVWFSHQRGNAVSYDSNNGANYVFRFIYQEVRLISATLERTPTKGTNTFSAKMAAAPVVNGVTIVYHMADRGVVGPEKRQGLANTGVGDGGDIVWSGEFQVAYDRVIVFDIVYEAEGGSFEDDNNRQHYMVFPPKHAEKAAMTEKPLVPADPLPKVVQLMEGTLGSGERIVRVTLAEPQFDSHSDFFTRYKVKIATVSGDGSSLSGVRCVVVQVSSNTGAVSLAPDMTCESTNDLG